MKETELNFVGKMYSDLKQDVAEVVIESLKPIQKEYDQIMKDKTYLNSVLIKGREKAQSLAFKTLRKVYKKIGFVPIKF